MSECDEEKIKDSRTPRRNRNTDNMSRLEIGDRPTIDSDEWVHLHPLDA